MERWCSVTFQCQDVLLIWIIVGQGPTVLAVGAGGGCLDIFSLIYHFSFLSASVWETACYRLRYCLKGLLSPKQPTHYFIDHTYLPNDTFWLYPGLGPNGTKLWTDARRPVPRLWIRSAEVRGVTSLGEREHNNNNWDKVFGYDQDHPEA